MSTIRWCFFEYNQADLEAFFQHKKKDSGIPKWATAKQLPLLLPLADLRHNVRRTYLQPEQQLTKLQQWHMEMLEDPHVAVSAADGRHLIAGGELGFKAFATVWGNQMDLVRRGYVSDPVDFELYFTTGLQPRTLLWTIKTKRGSNKNEAINKIAEAALMTTAKYREETGNVYTMALCQIALHATITKSSVLQEGVVGQQPQQQQQQQQQPSAAADGADGADAPDSAAGAADSAAANAAAAVVESGVVAAADAAAAAVDDDEFYEAAAAEYHAVAAAPASPYGSSKRRASAGVAAAVEACMVVDSDSEEEQPRKRRRISQLSHAAAVAAVAAAEDTGLQAAGADFTQHQQAAAAIAAAAAAARKGGSTGRIRSTSGGSPSSKHVRVRPGFVESRVPKGRRLHYMDFIGPVHTEDEQQLFQSLLEQHCSSSMTCGVRDWAAFTRDWNLEAFSNLSSGGKAVLTFKQVSHLKDYDKSLARTAGQLAGVAMAASSGQEQQQQQQQQQPELLPQMSDMAAALKSIISECVQDLCQPSGSSPAELHLQLPDILRDLLTQVVGHISPDVPGDAAQQHDLAEDAARPAAPAAAAAAAAAGGAAGAAAQASPAMPSAGVTAAAALAAGAVAAAAAAGCAAGQAPAAAAQHAFSKMMASGRSAGGWATQRVSKKTGRRTVPGAGKGKGAAGGSKVCVPCTLRKHSLHYAEEARTHADAVFNDKWHQPTSSTPCPYCKCKVCKRSWDHSRRIDNYNFPLKADCPHGN
uniref:Uncharacterized protein n=1 Tax=Tetradesmus obliquus TaxID=3088 RepID=A0A383VFF8_TETOB|eukprot:jgi/Sobl393_1/19558/SZX63404.1